MDRLWTRLVACMLAAVFLVPALASTTEAKGGGPAPGTTWVIMYYGAGDGGNGASGAPADLEPQILHDLDEMQLATHTNVKTVAMVDRTTSWPGAKNSYPRYYEIGYGTRVLKKDLRAELNMADPMTLSNFVYWAKTTYPSTHYALVLSDHGKGWMGVCYDWTSLGDLMTVNELQTALSSIKARTGMTLDVLALDACLMAGVEVAYAAKDYCRTLVASQDLEYCGTPSPVYPYPYDPNSGGFDYQGIVDTLSHNTLTDARGCAKIMADSYNAFRAADPTGLTDWTMSAFDLQNTYWTNFMQGIQGLANSLIQRLPTYKWDIKACRDSVQRMGEDAKGAFFIDLYDYVLLVDSKNMAEDRGLVQSMGAITFAIDAMRIVEYHGAENPNAHGLDIYFPSPETAYDSSYSSIAFSGPGVAPSWNTFIVEYWATILNG